MLGMHTVNLIFESSPRWVLAEHLGYELFRRAGVPAPDSGHFRLSVDGQDLGYHLYIEQPSEAYLSRRDRDTAGNLYKIVWFESGLTRQHEKKNHPLGRHEDLKEVVAGLASRHGTEQWDFIRERFDVGEFAGYYAVSQCIENWDGYFNNHFVFHAPGPGGRWEIHPWDLDKTWGDFDGTSAKYDWYTFPLTYGMNGDQPPPGAGRFPGMGFGGMSWWRPGGWFSGPLLANPGFREQYLKRLRGLCDTAFNEAKFRPVIDDLEKRLEPEVRHRAEARGRARGRDARAIPFRHRFVPAAVGAPAGIHPARVGPEEVDARQIERARLRPGGTSGIPLRHDYVWIRETEKSGCASLLPLAGAGARRPKEAPHATGGRVGRRIDRGGAHRRHRVVSQPAALTACLPNPRPALSTR